MSSQVLGATSITEPNSTYLSVWWGAIQKGGKPAETILREVAEEYGVTVAALIGPGRMRAVAHPRFAAMRRLRDNPMPSGELRSLPKIGLILGGRDHTTILAGLRRYAQLTDIPFNPQEP